jgi:hypothetical protein
MSISISNTAESYLQNVPKATAPVSKARSNPEDTLNLSQSAQTEAISRSGVSASAKSSSLGDLAAFVDHILGIVTRTTVVVRVQAGQEESALDGVSPHVTATEG